MKRFSIFLLLFLSCATAAPEPPRYLFYLHGRAIEDGGRNAVTDFGPYEYDRILETLTSHGFTVRSEARPKGTDPREYAKKIATEVRELIAGGVNPRHITIVGASKGGVITMLVSTELQHPDVNYVLMGNCNDSILRDYSPRLAGRILSIYDQADTFGGTCERFRAAGTNITAYDEIAILLGHGHGFLYKPYDAWVQPAVAWARRP